MSTYSRTENRGPNSRNQHREQKPGTGIWRAPARLCGAGAWVPGAVLLAPRLGVLRVHGGEEGGEGVRVADVAGPVRLEGVQHLIGGVEAVLGAAGEGLEHHRLEGP